MHWQTSRYTIDLSRPRVMGIVNVTPDSFSDGGRFANPSAALAHCEQLLKEGADILDIGGESTRPGAVALDVAEELHRVLPVLRHAVTLGVPVSVDTYKPQVMQAALDLGADIINDVWALRWQPGLATAGEAAGVDGLSAETVVARHRQCGVCLMHMHREPGTMQVEPMQGDVLPPVLAFLATRAAGLQAAGVAASRICLDPGIGFGKTVQQNFALLARQQELVQLGYPVLAGWSRKSSLAAVAPPAGDTIRPAGTGRTGSGYPDMSGRMAPSIAAALVAVQRGAHIVRVHDVQETVQTLKVWAAVQAQMAEPQTPH